MAHARQSGRTRNLNEIIAEQDRAPTVVVSSSAQDERLNEHD